MHVLVVEDDEMLANAVATGLRQGGCTCALAATAKRAQLELVQHRFSAVLLDLVLPDGSGLDLLATMRARFDPTPVIVITARDQLTDRIRGLDAGADDYIVKPFELAELHARLRAVIRRAEGRVANVLSCGDIVLDPAKGEVTRAGNIVSLSVHELRTLRALLEKKGRVVSRSQLEAEVYEDASRGSNTIAVYVHQLRRKLGDDVIQTVHGFGYRIVGEDE